MTIGIFAFDGTIDPAKYSDCKVYIANPIMPAGLAYQLNAGSLNLMNAGCDSIVFMGNHCTPQDDTVKSHIEQLESHLYPLVTCGRVFHPDNNWKDYRETGEAKRLGLFNRAGTIIQNSSILTSGYGISVANFGMNRAAFDRISRFSKMYFNSEGPLPVLPLESSEVFDFEIKVFPVGLIIGNGSGASEVTHPGLGESEEISRLARCEKLLFRGLDMMRSRVELHGHFPLQLVHPLFKGDDFPC